MQIVIDVPEETYQDILKNGFIYDEDNEVITHAIKNGTPHETVTEFADRCRECGRERVLDKIRAEIEKQENWLFLAGFNTYNIDIAFNSIKAVLAESEDKE